ncbi:hypothetical protein AB4Y36_22175 [Paraburkholderia sp. BR10936]|uniref:hypothetical protein n=1 Tax=Paraburkholderia sp. BR10936 TaxID=3236993 RepID=UPI0034D2B85C
MHALNAPGAEDAARLIQKLPGLLPIGIGWTPSAAANLLDDTLGYVKLTTERLRLLGTVLLLLACSEDHAKTLTEAFGSDYYSRLSKRFGTL